MSGRLYSKRVPQRTAVRRPRARPKTFKTKELAKAWAEKQGIKKYKLVNIKSPEAKTKKVKVVTE